MISHPQPLPRGTGDLSIDACARELDCSRTTVYRLMSEGQLEYYKLGPRGDRRITRTSLNFMKENCVEEVA